MLYIWVFPKIEVPQNGWFIMENPIFSRMRSEGFPFIVGVLGLDLCSRLVGRVVVVSSSLRH